MPANELRSGGQRRARLGRYKCGAERGRAERRDAAAN